MKNELSLKELAMHIIELGEKASAAYVNRRTEVKFASETSPTIIFTGKINEAIKHLSNNQLNILEGIVKEELINAEADSARYYGCTRVLSSINEKLNPVENVWSK